MTDNTDGSENGMTRREAMQGTGVALGSLVASGTLTDTVMAQSGGPTNEISGIVEDESGPVEGATVVAVPHDTSLAALETTTATDGTYQFAQSDLHEGENLYHVIARDGTESNPRRGEQNYPFVAAEGPAAIPDSAIHQWKLDDVGTGTATDSIGSADGTVNGVISTSGTWVGDAAGDGDGTDDYIEHTTLGSFNSGLNSSAFAYTVQTTATDSTVLSGVRWAANTWTRPSHLNFNSSGDIGFSFRDEDGNRVEGSTGDVSVNDGNPHRIMINVVDASANDVEVWVDGTEQSVTNGTAESPSNFGDMQENYITFAWDSGGSGQTISNRLEGVMDNHIICNDSLTAQEIQTDYNSQPWS